MKNIFYPKAHFNNIYEITPNFLKNKGVEGVLLDIDNTLVPYAVKVPSEKVLTWLTTLQEAGIKAAILSNAKAERIATFTEQTGLPIIEKAGKPLKRGFRQAEKLLGMPKEKLCIIGDQFFTDIWGGNRSKVYSIWVTPINNEESAFIRLKRWLERPIVKGYRKVMAEKGGDTVGLLGVIGYPIGHSISPQLHQALCDVSGMNYFYDKFLVEPSNLKEAFADFAKKGFRGINVTVPHKPDIIPLLDEVDANALKIGAVNTVVWKDGKSYGYNTDMDGFVMSVKEEANFDFDGKRVLILGAGGAARGVAMGCVTEGAAQVDFCNRTVEKAQALADAFDGGVLSQTDEAFAEKFQTYDLIVNTTSAGMKPQEDKMPLTAEYTFRKGQVCFDAIYVPRRTLWLQKAEKEGATVINGMGMLFYQGVEAFQKWKMADNTKPLTAEQIAQAKALLQERGVMTW